MSENINKRIDEATESWASAWGGMDPNTWKDIISWDQYDPPIAHEWTRWTFEMIDTANESGLSSKELAECFSGIFSLRWGGMYSELWSAQYADVSTEERLKIFMFFDKLLRAIAYEDPYGFAKNIVHSRKEINTLSQNLKTGNKEIARQLGRVTNACYHIGHAFYSDMHPNIAYDIDGPYALENDNIMIIRRFRNLRCPELWPETKNIPHDSIDIVTVYKNVTMKADAIVHTVYEGNLVENLLAYNLWVDGKVFPIENLANISEILEKAAANIFKKFISFGHKNKTKKYLYQRAYEYKQLRDKIGQEWKPKEQMFRQAISEPLYKPKYPKGDNNFKKTIKKMIDPRIDCKTEGCLV